MGGGTRVEMSKGNEFGGCRHCGHTPVHSSARACPYCGGIAPYTRTPPKKSRNWLVAVLSLAVIVLAGAVAYVLMVR